MTTLIVNEETFPVLIQKPPAPASRGMGEEASPSCGAGTEVRLSHLNSGSKLFPVLSTPIKTHDYANTYTLPQFASYSNMSGHGMSAGSLLPTEASGKACFHLTDTAPGLDPAQSQLSTSQWQIILSCFQGVHAVVSVPQCICSQDQ